MLPQLPLLLSCAVNTLTGKVLDSPHVLQLVQAMLFVQTKKLYDTQEGRAAAPTPRTSRSCRPIEGPAHSSRGVRVRCYGFAAGHRHALSLRVSHGRRFAANRMAPAQKRVQPPVLGHEQCLGCDVHGNIVTLLHGNTASMLLQQVCMLFLAAACVLQVPTHHNTLATALGLDYLLAGGPHH